MRKIEKIEKLISEYNIWELYKIPYGKFKIRIYCDLLGMYRGVTNLQAINKDGNFCCGVGIGETEESALENTLNNFFEILSRKDIWEEEDFQCLEPYEF